MSPTPGPNRRRGGRGRGDGNRWDPARRSSWSLSAMTREKAPSRSRQDGFSRASTRSASGLTVRWRASSSAIRSLSLVTTPGQHARLVGQRLGVGQVAVVAEGEALVARPSGTRAGRCARCSTRSWSSGVAHGHVAFESGQLVLVEDVGDQAHVLDDHHGVAVAHRHARRLLTPVLEGVDARRRSGGRPTGRGRTHRRRRTLPGAACDRPIRSPGRRRRSPLQCRQAAA